MRHEHLKTNCEQRGGIIELPKRLDRDLKILEMRETRIDKLFYIYLYFSHGA